MTEGPDLEINADLFAALVEVLGHKPTEPEPVVVVAQYLYSLAGDYGLSDSTELTGSHLENLAPPAATSPLIDHYLGLEDIEADGLRGLLCEVFTELSARADSRRVLNKAAPIHEVGFLIAAQVCWNLEASGRCAGLPLKPAPGRDIPVQQGSQDFARMRWTERTNTGVVGLGDGRAAASSGASFRLKGALLAVLAARLLVDRRTGPAPAIPGLSLSVTQPDRGKARACIHLTQPRQSEATPRNSESVQSGVVADHRRRSIAWPENSDLETDTQVAASTDSAAHAVGIPILIGSFAEVGDVYEERGFDVEIERAWSDGGNRRLWLRGGPGLGKSLAARRVMQNSLADRSSTKDELLVWVDSADSTSVTKGLARAAERMPGVGIAVAADEANRDDRLARSLLDHLRTTETRWLIVFDDANADELIRHDLLPPGTNPNGRALITTLGVSGVDSAGRQIIAEQFTKGEAERFLLARLPNSSADDRSALAHMADHHPLVLSLATATIAAERMSVDDWLAEFNTKHMNVAADHPDSGGYPHPITGTWRVALEKAAQGLPDRAVERAAMVAAIQDPAGHPTWLWSRDAVRGWVDLHAEQSLASGRIHPAVRRLVDYGILQLIGTWKDGRVAIHQMAARAVRESANPELLAELAAILAKEWLLQLTAQPAHARPEDVGRGVRPLRSLPDLDSFTMDTLTALLEYADDLRGTSVYSRWARQEIDLIEPLLLVGGAIGRGDLAHRRTELGRAERILGREDVAHREFTAAWEIYSQLVAHPHLADGLRAEFLESMAAVDESLGHPERASKCRQQAVKLRERIEPARSQPQTVFSNLIALTDLHLALQDEHRSRATLDRALAANTERPPSNSEDAASEHVELARRLASHGRVKEAAVHMRRAARLYSKSEYGRVLHSADIGRELARLFAQLGEWKKAERWMKRSGVDAAELASVQLHQGRDDAARKTLARGVVTPTPSLDDETIPTHFGPITEELRPHDFGRLAMRAAAWERWDEAADLALVRLELVRARASSTPGDDPAGLANAFEMAGVYSSSAGRHEAATEFLTAGVNILELLSQLDPADAAARQRHGSSLVQLARVHLRSGQIAQGVDVARRAVSVLEPLDTDEPVAIMDPALQVLADAHMRAGTPDQAITVSRRRVEIARTHLDTDSSGPASIDDLADRLQTLTAICVSTGHGGEALQSATELVNLRQAATDDDVGDAGREESLASALFLLGVVHDALGNLIDSEASTRRAVTIWQRLLEHDPGDSERQARLAYGLAAHGMALDKLDRDHETLDAMIRAADYLQLPAELNPTDHASQQIQLLKSTAVALRSVNRDTEADEMDSRADDLARRFPDDGGGLK